MMEKERKKEFLNDGVRKKERKERMGVDNLNEEKKRNMEDESDEDANKNRSLPLQEIRGDTRNATIAAWRVGGAGKVGTSRERRQSRE